MTSQEANDNDNLGIGERGNAQDPLTAELSHRIRNLFAVVSGLVHLSARESPEMRPFALAVQRRIDALAVAHQYVRPYGGQSAPDDDRTVHGLLRVLTAPYNGRSRPTTTIEGEDAAIGPTAAETIALIVHELATNAMKHGAFANDAGTVKIACAAGEKRYLIRWREEGGPEIRGKPRHRGFGVTFVDRLATSRRFEVRRTWRREGLEVSISTPLDALAG
jgi:two-component sensor histidine kinase